MPSSREVIRALEDAGWRVLRQNGSHVVLVLTGDPDRHVVLAHPRRDVSLGLLRSIERDSGLRLRPKR